MRSAWNVVGHPTSRTWRHRWRSNPGPRYGDVASHVPASFVPCGPLRHHRHAGAAERVDDESHGRRQVDEIVPERKRQDEQDARDKRDDLGSDWDPLSAHAVDTLDVELVLARGVEKPRRRPREDVGRSCRKPRPVGEHDGRKPAEPEAGRRLSERRRVAQRGPPVRQRRMRQRHQEGQRDQGIERDRKQDHGKDGHRRCPLWTAPPAP